MESERVGTRSLLRYIIEDYPDSCHVDIEVTRQNPGLPWLLATVARRLPFRPHRGCPRTRQAGQGGGNGALRFLQMHGYGLDGA